ncbi:MAG TPA: S8 family peptidase, partial [Vicinamibacterales bacterium]
MIRHWLPRSVVALVAMLAVAGTATTAAAQDKLDRALREGKNSGKAQRVILKAKPGYAEWARQLLAKKGKKIDAELPSIGAFAVEMTDAELKTFCEESTVSDGCSADTLVTPSAARARGAKALKSLFSAWPANTVLGTLGLNANPLAGYGVTVAVIDSGIYPSAAFGTRIKAFYDFTTGGVVKTRPNDSYGHGTHVAGLIGGNQYLSDVAYQGVAPSVQFVGLKVLNSSGAGKTSDVIRAIEFAIANKHTFGIDIINLSLGHPIFEPAATDPLVQAVEKATKAGIIVVASAGNHGVDENGDLGFGGVTSPGNAPSAITVGAVDHKHTVTRDDDKLAPYSSNGPTWYDGLVKPDVVAPGHMLASEAAPRSSLFKNYPTLHKKGPSGKEFETLSGTSMSAAVVTGVVAILEQATGRAMTPNLAKGVLQFTAVPLTEDGVTINPLRQGTGSVNAKGALSVVNNIDATVTDLQTTWLQTGLAKQTTIGTQTYAWAGNIVWGDNIVW